MPLVVPVWCAAGAGCHQHLPQTGEACQKGLPPNRLPQQQQQQQRRRRKQCQQLQQWQQAVAACVQSATCSDATGSSSSSVCVVGASCGTAAEVALVLLEIQQPTPQPALAPTPRPCPLFIAPPPPPRPPPPPPTPARPVAAAQFQKDPESLCTRLEWKDDQDKVLWVFRMQVRRHEATGCCSTRGGWVGGGGLQGECQATGCWGGQEGQEGGGLTGLRPQLYTQLLARTPPHLPGKLGNCQCIHAHLTNPLVSLRHNLAPTPCR
jgi:hypothetical protein